MWLLFGLLLLLLLFGCWFVCLFVCLFVVRLFVCFDWQMIVVSVGQDMCSPCNSVATATATETTLATAQFRVE